MPSRNQALAEELLPTFEKKEMEEQEKEEWAIILSLYCRLFPQELVYETHQHLAGNLKLTFMHYMCSISLIFIDARPWWSATHVHILQVEDLWVFYLTKTHQLCLLAAHMCCDFLLFSCSPASSHCQQQADLWPGLPLSPVLSSSLWLPYESGRFSSQKMTSFSYPLWNPEFLASWVFFNSNETRWKEPDCKFDCSIGKKNTMAKKEELSCVACSLLCTWLLAVTGDWSLLVLCSFIQVSLQNLEYTQLLHPSCLLSPQTPQHLQALPSHQPLLQSFFFFLRWSNRQTDTSSLLMASFYLMKQSLLLPLTSCMTLVYALLKWTLWACLHMYLIQDQFISE